MKIPTIIQAALIAFSLAGAAPAAHAAPAAKHTATLDAPRCHASLSPYACSAANSSDKPLMPANYASNPANGAFAAAADSDSERDKVPPADAAKVDAAAAPVPEPQMFLMMLIGLVLLGFTFSRREAFEKFTD